MPTGKVDGAMQVGEWLVTPSLDTISRGAESHKLEPRTTRLLLCLVNAAPEVVSVDRLLTEVWSGVVVGSASVYQAVSQLRKLLGDSDPNPTYIATVARKGYRLIAAVRRVDALDEIASSAAATRAPTVALPAMHQHKLVPSAILIAASIAVMAAGAFIWKQTTSARLAASVNSIAVLPFADMSEKKDQEYFSDGLSEELIDLLSQVSDLRVPARTSSFYFKGKSEDIAAIAQKLHVANVLEGSVRKAGNRLRVTAQLIRADNGYSLWSETYDRDLKDIFEVQDEIASAVVAALKLKLAPLRPNSTSHGTLNSDAYNEYLLGRQLMNRANDPVGYRRAATVFRKAIALDEHYAAPYAGLAYAESIVADETGELLGLERAEQDAGQAVALAPDRAEGYAARGYLRFVYQWNWAGAQADLETALALDAGDSKVIRQYGQLLACLGRLPEAIAAAKRSTELDPLSDAGWLTLDRYLIASGQYGAAREANRRALEIQPEDSYVLHDLGELELLEGHARAASEAFRQVRTEGVRLMGTAMTEYTLGHPNESQEALDQLITKNGQAWAYQIAEVYAWRKEKDKAFEWLDLGYEHHDGGMSNVKVDAFLISLRGDPRFGALLKKMQLPAQ